MRIFLGSPPGKKAPTERGRMRKCYTSFAGPFTAAPQISRPPADASMRAAGACWPAGASSADYSIQLGAGEGHDPAPLLSFIGQESSEIERGSGKWAPSQISEARLQNRVRQAKVDLSVQQLRNFGRCAARCPYPEPGACLISLHEIADRGYLRQRLRSVCGGHRQHA